MQSLLVDQMRLVVTDDQHSVDRWQVQMLRVLDVGVLVYEVSQAFKLNLDPEPEFGVPEINWQVGLLRGNQAGVQRMINLFADHRWLNLFS